MDGNGDFSNHFSYKDSEKNNDLFINGWKSGSSDMFQERRLDVQLVCIQGGWHVCAEVRFAGLRKMRAGHLLNADSSLSDLKGEVFQKP